MADIDPSRLRVEVVAAVGSTNTELMRRLAVGELGVDALPLWLRAETQTAGRGRNGRAWGSAPGNLFASLAVPLTAPPQAVPQLALVVGIAVHDTITRVLSGSTARPRLKWPNDVLLGGAKISGILCESTTIPGEATRVAVIGVGINVASSPPDVDRAVTSIAAVNSITPPPVDDVLAALDSALRHWLGVWADGMGFDWIRDAWRLRGHQQGEPLTVHLNAPKSIATSPLTGHFAGLDTDGALLLARADGHCVRITYGDVTAS